MHILIFPTAKERNASSDRHHQLPNRTKAQYPASGTCGKYVEIRAYYVEEKEEVLFENNKLTEKHGILDILRIAPSP